MEQATARLLTYDMDDDEDLTLADFKSGSEQVPGWVSNRRRVYEAEVALSISPLTDWDYVRYSLEEFYADDDPLPAQDVSAHT